MALETKAEHNAKLLNINNTYDIKRELNAINADKRIFRRPYLQHELHAYQTRTNWDPTSSYYIRAN